MSTLTFVFENGTKFQAAQKLVEEYAAETPWLKIAFVEAGGCPPNAGDLVFVGFRNPPFRPGTVTGIGEVKVISQAVDEYGFNESVTGSVWNMLAELGRQDPESEHLDCVGGVPGETWEGYGGQLWTCVGGRFAPTACKVPHSVVWGWLQEKPDMVC